MQITPSGQSHGATVSGLNLAEPLAPATVAALRQAWLEHGVLAFPEQDLSDDDLERFTTYFGPFGEDPFIAPIPGRKHVIAVQRNKDETASVFAEGWHTDWSFQVAPPAGTCLYGITIPPHGGNTMFVNQRLALAAMPADLRAELEGKRALHSARVAYSPDGMYGKADKTSGRSMEIIANETATAVQAHPIIRPHPETGIEELYGCFGYIVGIEGMADADAFDLLKRLHAWQTRPEFQYDHQWQANMLVMWDNRSELHRATGGYEGYDRLLHRTTIGAYAG
jgi:taurine dioxygenase